MPIKTQDTTQEKPRSAENLFGRLRATRTLGSVAARFSERFGSPKGRHAASSKVDRLGAKRGEISFNHPQRLYTHPGVIAPPSPDTLNGDGLMGIVKSEIHNQAPDSQGSNLGNAKTEENWPVQPKDEVTPATETAMKQKVLDYQRRRGFDFEEPEFNDGPFPLLTHSEDYEPPGPPRKR